MAFEIAQSTLKWYLATSTDLPKGLVVKTALIPSTLLLALSAPALGDLLDCTVEKRAKLSFRIPAGKQARPHLARVYY
jgi:hypothetical protein